MAALADLQPDRRAVLQLLVGRGRGYDQIAELLSMPEIVVRRRAHDAITTLAGGPGDIDDAQRALLCDYLVGELPASRRAEARTLLADDPAARRFARAAAARLSGIEGAQLPELPPEDEEVADALDALDARRERQEELESSSKLGAWLIVGAIAIAVVAIVVVLAFVAGKDGGDSPQANTPASTTKSTTARPVYGAQLTSPSGGSATGQALMRPTESGAIALAVKATGVEPTKQLDGGRFTAYAFWLDGPSGPVRLGFYETAESANGATATKGNIDLGVVLDGKSTPAFEEADLAKYDELLITRETLASVNDRPAKPGPVVLSGPISTVQ